MDRGVVLLVSLSLMCFWGQAQTCHYSCLTCSDKSYSSCLTCPYNNAHTYRVITDPQVLGTCASITTGSVNILGIILFIIILCGVVIIFQEQIMYLFFFFQSLGLIYLVDASLTPKILDYLYQAASYLMVFSKITYNTKSNPTQNPNTSICKGHIFFVQFQLPKNILVIILVNLILFLLMLTIAILKSTRKRCVFERAQCCPDWILDKINIVLSTCFIFTIQQTNAIIFFSLKYGTVTVDRIMIVVFYYAALILFMINQFLYPLSYFRNKGAQLNLLIGKFLSPIFLVFPVNLHFVLFIILLLFWIIDLAFTHKNRNNARYNRLFIYKINGLIILLLTLIYYAVQILKNSAKSSLYIGIICTVVLVVQFQFPLVELLLKLKKQYCQQTQKQKKKRKKKQQKNKSSSQSQDLTKKEQITLENIKLDENINDSTSKQHHFRLYKGKKPIQTLNYNFNQNVYEQKSNQKRQFIRQSDIQSALNPSEVHFSQKPSFFKQAQIISIRAKQTSQNVQNSQKQQRQLQELQAIKKQNEIVVNVDEFQDIPQKQDPVNIEESLDDKKRKKKYHKSKKKVRQTNE